MLEKKRGGKEIDHLRIITPALVRTLLLPPVQTACMTASGVLSQHFFTKIDGKKKNSRRTIRREDTWISQNSCRCAPCDVPDTPAPRHTGECCHDKSRYQISRLPCKMKFLLSMGEGEKRAIRLKKRRSWDRRSMKRCPGLVTNDAALWTLFFVAGEKGDERSS